MDNVTVSNSEIMALLFTVKAYFFLLIVFPVKRLICTKFGLSSEKVCSFTAFCASTRCHLGLCSPLIHSIVSNDTADSEGPDQTVQMRSLI